MAITDKIVTKERLTYFKTKLLTFLNANGYKNTIEQIHYSGYTGSEYDATIDQLKKATLKYSAVGKVYGSPERGAICAMTQKVSGQEYGLEIAIGSKLNDPDFVEFNMYDTEAGDQVSVSKQLTTKSYVDNNSGKIDKIKVNGTEQTITNKEVDLQVVSTIGSDDAQGNQTTFKVTGEGGAYSIEFAKDESGLSYKMKQDAAATVLTDKEYVDSTFRTEAQVAAAIAEAQTGAFVKVDSYSDLPAEGASGKIYLVPNSGSGQNVYDEYIWCVVAMIAGGGESPVYGYEKIGTTAVDLSGYVQESDLSEITEAEIDAMFA